MPKKSNTIEICSLFENMLFSDEQVLRKKAVIHW